MRSLTLAGLLLLSSLVPALAETNVGVTAAVNPAANGTVGGNVRTIALGDSVIFNEHIQTDKAGLVQILLADGTTFMVGPNSDLTIDKFVYDPDAGTAQVTASFTKGVLRFIGGQTSKTENGVTLNTPVGTMGIRGAMVDVVLDPPAGTPQHIDMLFGNEVTLEEGKSLLGRLYASGYSLVLGDDGKFDVFKTPPGWGSDIQAALAGGPGTSGGAPKGPKDGDVKNSDAAKANSGNGVDKNTGTPLSKEEQKQLLEAVAAYDELRNYILNNPQSSTGFIGGLVTFNVYGDDDIFSGAGSWTTTHNWETAALEPAKVTFGPDGQPATITVPLLVTGNDEACGEIEGPSFCGRIDYVSGADGAGKLVYTTLEGDVTEYPTTDGFLVDYTHYLDEDRLAELDCQSCDQMVKWGFWGFKASGFPNGEDTTADADAKGAWITGDMTTKAQMDHLADITESNVTATYSGDAVGMVHNDDVEGDYTATGDLSLEWKFAEREGTATISNFDADHVNGNRDFTFDLTTPTGQAGFSGEAETDYDDTDLYGGGSMKGNFVNKGSDVAAGVMGDWQFDEYQIPECYLDDDILKYSVGGVFMGERNP